MPYDFYYALNDASLLIPTDNEDTIFLQYFTVFLQYFYLHNPMKDVSLPR